MLNLPEEFVLFDTEFTAWEGSRERGWSGVGEHREIVQMGAVKVSNSDLKELDHFVQYVKPVINPILSDYFVNLTGITQAKIEEAGVNFNHAVSEFKKWCGTLPVYSFGSDGDVVKENCELVNIPCPFPENQFHNIRDFFLENGISTEEYYSSTIVRAFGVEPKRRGHDALSDARTVLDALVLLDKRNSH